MKTYSTASGFNPDFHYNYSIFEGKSYGNRAQSIPVKNTVTLVDLDARSCIPCKMMAPILKEP